MTWGYSKEETTDSLKHKSYAVRKAFADAANAVLNRGLDTEAAEFAGYAAVSRLERKQSEESQTALDLIKKQNKPPAHLAAVLEAANLKKQAVLDQQEAERNKLQELKDSILQEVQSDTANAIVDMKVLGEDVLLVQKNGKTLRRKLADYVVNQSVVVTAGQEPTFTNPNPSLGVGGIPEGSTFIEQDMQSMFDQLLYPFTIALAASPSLVEIGTVLTSINLAWNVSESDSVLSLSQGIGDVTGLTSYEYTVPTSTDTTFTITATKDAMTRVANSTVSFKNRVITAVTPNLVPTEVELLSAGGVLSDSFVRTVTYDCSGGNRFYIAYPSRLGTLSSAKVNGLSYNDWTTTTFTYTNSSGYAEEYVVLVSNNILYGSAIPVAWGQ